MFRLLADATVAVHLAFVLFVVFGGLLVMRRPRLAWVHLPAAAWGAWIEFAGWICPLTPLENWLRQQGGGPVAPDPAMGHAANFLYMLSGTRPSPTAIKAMDIALILHADHELNASTFAARVTAATLSDLHSAVTSAIGALKGPLHGGANEQVMLMVEKIGNPAKAGSTANVEILDTLRRAAR